MLKSINSIDMKIIIIDVLFKIIPKKEIVKSEIEIIKYLVKLIGILKIKGKKYYINYQILLGSPR